MCARLDHQFGMIVEALKDRDFYDQTAIFMFSDHGDFTGDYGLVEKTQNTFEDCLTHVPFIIKPPTETIAGDYVVSVRASGKQTSANEIDIRVTVESPTIWGWVGVGIILVVIAGLAVIFMRLSRR